MAAEILKQKTSLFGSPRQFSSIAVFLVNYKVIINIWWGCNFVLDTIPIVSF